MTSTTPTFGLSSACALALLLAALAGCNTIEGAGQDIEAAGEAVESTAESASD